MLVLRIIFLVRILDENIFLTPLTSNILLDLRKYFLEISIFFLKIRIRILLCGDIYIIKSIRYKSIRYTQSNNNISTVFG